ncbi:unnamed protein product, partial [Brassica oleracea]
VFSYLKGSLEDKEKVLLMNGSVKEIANLCSLSSLEINKNGTIRVGVDTNVFFRKRELVIGRMISLYKWRKRLKRS